MFKLIFRKKKKRLPNRKNNKVRKANVSKRFSIRSKRNITAKNYYPYMVKNNIYSSIIIFFAFISLSLTIVLFIKQIQPFINNERLKFLCTYQMGDKKNKIYKEAKIKLDKIVGNGDEFCRNFIFPKEKVKRGFRFISIMKNIVFKFI